MKTTHVLFFVLLVALLISGCSFNIYPKDAKVVNPSNTVISEVRPVSGFTGINMAAFGKVIITQGDHESLTIKGSDNVVPLILTTVDNGVLVIRTENNINITGMNNENVLTFTITVKDLENLTVSGAGEATMASLSTSDLNVTMSGAGQVSVDGLAAKSLNVTVSGVGGVDLSGEANTARIDISGAGNIKAPSLKIQTANITISGIGGAECWVTGQLTGTISGGGNVSYYGNPQLDTKTPGLGTFKSLGSK